jgi:anthranilate/para-aminobenzoate synthase component II
VERRLKLFFVDFEDSFSHNIFYFLKKIDVTAKFINYEKAPQLIDPSQDIVVLGPGPGHPEEYHDFSSWLKSVPVDEWRAVMGICLGHQLWWNNLGVKTSASQMPKHGETLELLWPIDAPHLFKADQLIKVQRYNSLSVKVDGPLPIEVEWHAKNGEDVIMGGGKNWITYQFHPESVGTSCPEKFFDPVRSWRYDSYKPLELKAMM